MVNEGFDPYTFGCTQARNNSSIEDSTLSRPKASITSSFHSVSKRIDTSLNVLQ
jgi:hypothetical protein